MAGAGRHVLGSCSGAGGHCCGESQSPSPLGSEGGVWGCQELIVLLVPDSPPCLTLGLWTDESGLWPGSRSETCSMGAVCGWGCGSNLSPVSIAGESRLKRAWFCWRQGQFGSLVRLPLFTFPADWSKHGLGLSLEADKATCLQAWGLSGCRGRAEAFIL